MRKLLGRLLLSAAACLSSLGATAQTLVFDRADVANVTPGIDLWKNTYTFSSALAGYGGFTLLFSPTQYGTLSVSSVASVLSALVIQPDAGIGAEGLVSLTALSGQPATFSTQFTVTYAKVGLLTNTHPYEIFDADFNIVFAGEAVLTPVPEPSSLALAIACVLTFGALAGAHNGAIRRRRPISEAAA